MIRSNINDFLICDVKVTETYSYYGYLTSGSDARAMIIRESTNEREYRYLFIRGSEYANIWTNVGTVSDNYNWIKPNELPSRG